ncbi:hypothetical protein [Azospirillum doebereinerae]
MAGAALGATFTVGTETRSLEFRPRGEDGWKGQVPGTNEKALEPLGSKAFPLHPELVGATGFEPATPRLACDSQGVEIEKERSLKNLPIGREFCPIPQTNSQTNPCLSLSLFLEGGGSANVLAQ